VPPDILYHSSYRKRHPSVKLFFENYDFVIRTSMNNGNKNEKESWVFNPVNRSVSSLLPENGTIGFN